MKASIQDSNALRAVGAGELGSYLRSSGWQEVRLLGDRAAIWQTRNEDGEEFETLIPQKRSSDDYALRVAQTIETLSVVEARSELDIYADILQTQTDTVRFVFSSSVYEDGSVPLEYAMKMVQSVREMTLAAACATVSPRAAYAKRKHQQAIDHLEKVRMGQTDRGSFIIALHTPVTPRLLMAEREQTAFDLNLPEYIEEEPFERRVTLTLASSLNAALNASLRISATRDFVPFQEAVKLGVNSNLCDALANVGLETPTRSLTVAFQWSPTRSLLQPTPRPIEFSTDQFTVLREAAKLFRESAPIDEFDLEGYVVKLGKETGEIEGQITVAGYVDNRPRRIRIKLEGADYECAVNAHRDTEAIQCTGELVKEGHAYTLKNPRNFVLLA